MTCAAVGDALGITEVAAESLLARARRRLRKEVTAKAAPADLFGVGGLGLLPSLLRAWRRAKDSVSRRTTMVQAATAKAFEAVGAVPSVDLAKGLVVVMGTALAVEMASAATPPVKPAVPVATQAATVSQPAPIAADGDPSSVSPASGGRLPVDIDGFIDPESRSAGVSTSGDVRAPDVDGTTEGHSGLNWDTGLLVDENGQTSLRARIFVNDDAGESLVDTGHIAEEVDATP
jgi:hypothetical protein